jgi:hypothetical protein
MRLRPCLFLGQVLHCVLNADVNRIGLQVVLEASLP